MCKCSGNTSVDLEWSGVLRCAKGVPQTLYEVGQIKRLAITQGDRKKVAAARDAVASIIGEVYPERCARQPNDWSRC